jgi:hypothetical protein
MRRLRLGERGPERAGNAAQHAERTGHEVHVEQTIGVIYNKKSKS